MGTFNSPLRKNGLNDRSVGARVGKARSIIVSISIILVLCCMLLPNYAVVDRGSSSQLRQMIEQQILSVSSSDNEFALRDSLGFFDDVPNSVWKLHQKRVREESLFLHPNDPDKGMEKGVAYWMFHNADPLFICSLARRIGGRGDGPKWVCDPHRLKPLQDCLIYSVGSSGNYMFEDGLASIVGKGHCEIHVFDPNPRFERTGDRQNNNIHYHAWSLKSSYVESQPGLKGQSYSLPEIIEKLGHQGRRIDVFKIDCEGCEWTSYRDWISDSVDIRQIQVEIHGSTGRPSDVSLSGFFQELLDRGFVPFFKEANTHPAASPRGTLFEYAFLRFDPRFIKEDNRD